MKNKSKSVGKLSTSEILFLKYAYKGDGKYYITERGSGNYRNTTFSNFLKHNQDSVNITKRGNDAPRMGRTGEFMEVIFTPEFHTKFNQFFELQEKTEREVLMRGERAKEFAPIQAEVWRRMLITNPERLERYHTKISTSPSNGARSGNWRNWIRMKAAKHISGENFGELALSAPELRDIINEVMILQER